MSLQDEIEERRRAIKTDSYSMSVGEIMNLYASKELHINPNFQRMFRWNSEQKTKLMESILLGIPIPPIFVSQRDTGVWDLIDGLQRLSTIFEFSGILRDKDGKEIQPSTLSEAKYLKSLSGKTWQSDRDDDPNTLTANQRIDIKRAKIDVNIIMRESDANAKYDLFERINTGGTKLSDQEVRNCLLIMANVEFYNKFEEFRENQDFSDCIGITDRARDERYDMELASRFLVLRGADIEDVRKNIVDVGTYLSDELVRQATDNVDLDEERRVFDLTFKMINTTLGNDAFRRYDAERGKHLGMSQVSAFEAISLGLGYNIDSWNVEDKGDQHDFSERARRLWSTNEFRDKQGSGVRGTDRIISIIPFARQYFAK